MDNNGNVMEQLRWFTPSGGVADAAEGASQVQAPGSEALVGDENTTYGLCGRGTLVLIAR